MIRRADASQVRQSVAVGKSKLDVATLLLGNFNPNVYGRVENVDLRIRNVDFYMGQIESFLFAV